MSKKAKFVVDLCDAYCEAIRELPDGVEPIPFDWIWPQAALESNWGRSAVAEDCHNLFGMKGAHFGQGICKSHHPPTNEGPTGYTTFDSWAMCLVGYMRKITYPGNHFHPCFEIGLTSGKEAYWNCLARHGWAGSPNYGIRIASVARSIKD